MGTLIEQNLVLNQQASAKQQSFDSIGPSSGGKGQTPLLAVLGFKNADGFGVSKVNGLVTLEVDIFNLNRPNSWLARVWKDGSPKGSEMSV